MTLPGAETMKGGIMGEDCFLSNVLLPFMPLALGLSTILFEAAIVTRRGLSRIGEGEGDESDGVSIWSDVVVLVLDREWEAFAFEDRLVVVLVLVIVWPEST